MKEFSTSADYSSNASPVTSEEMRLQLEKVLQSHTLGSSALLQKLLRFVGMKAIEGHSSEIKEYVIAREVLRRKVDFDPRIDTAVRVDAHRLREKLDEYYRNEGANDEILLEIPKGHYVPRFSRRGPSGIRVPLPSDTQAAFPGNKESNSAGAGYPRPETSLAAFPEDIFRSGSQWRVPLAFTAGILVLSAILLLRKITTATTWGNWLVASSSASVKTDGGDDLSDFWAHFLKSKRQPIVTYSNAIFLVTRTSDLLRLKAEGVDELGAMATPGLAKRLVVNRPLLSRAGPVFFEDAYTGTGEVMAVFYLTQMFDHLHRSIEVERSRLVSIDDLRTHDVVFLGSTREDSLLAGLPVKGDFIFKWPAKPTGVWDGKIVDLHPRPGEHSIYEVERDSKTGTLRTDYALISVLPGIVPGRKVVVLGGLTTLGTQAAGEFATAPEGISQILALLGIRGPAHSDDFPPYIQAVLKVSIMKGGVVGIRCVGAHIMYAQPATSAQGGF